MCLQEGGGAGELPAASTTRAHGGNGGRAPLSMALPAQKKDPGRIEEGLGQGHADLTLQCLR